ncbi:hypothetical protein [Thiothrix fructosivorans]|jgi:hypothetical protein|uniref:HPt domain-containing protein n=1 Tax=Thiothrix fructosivorans TaxID=111770 RepID=A0A8B0SK83_9GAMM|nr:hypothetical protein [Thiothrix fructosivorans]MBO0613053.1 hypothetical protein [Thiothrix fructosivorans]QTX11501.1 hypothetical protein J1836_003885 [Thiothrix fructosivorans]
MTTATVFNTLVAMLGQESAQRFLAFAQPQIHQCKQDLLTHLQQHDWDSAAATAHRFKATAHLYSSARLIEQLDTIIQKPIQTLQHPAFSQDLVAEFQYIERAIQQFMANHANH